jgi:hypothetical protein
MRFLARFTILVAIVTITACNSTTTPGVDPTKPPTPDDGTAAVTPTQETSINPFDLDWEDRSIFSQSLVSGEQSILENSSEMTTYHMDVRISEDLVSLKGHQEVNYTNREDEPLDDVFFRLFPNVEGGVSEVSSVKVDGLDVDPVYEFANSAVRVPMDGTLQPGKETIISMDFRLEIPNVMSEDYYGLFGFFDGILVLNEFYPVIPVYDEEGWNVEVPPPNGDFSNFDASLYVVRVTAPKDLTVVASGITASQANEGDNQVITFVLGPARDFYIAASSDFEVVSDTIGETIVNSYTLKGLDEGARLSLDYALDSIESFSTRFGTYPYTEFDIVITPMLALGIEYPGVTAILLGLYDADPDSPGTPHVWLESTIAHEVGHQWFYNIVGNDQIDEPWVDESLTQYVTGLYFLDQYGAGGYQGYRESWVGRWERSDFALIPIGLPAEDYIDSEGNNTYSAIVYGRGPLFVEALAEEMGQPTFDDFLRDYYQTFKWGRATALSFQQLAEEHCSCDLGDLFDEWVYGE